MVTKGREVLEEVETEWTTIKTIYLWPAGRRREDFSLRAFPGLANGKVEAYNDQDQVEGLATRYRCCA